MLTLEPAVRKCHPAPKICSHKADPPHLQLLRPGLRSQTLSLTVSQSVFHEEAEVWLPLEKSFSGLGRQATAASISWRHGRKSTEVCNVNSASLIRESLAPVQG